MIVAVKNREAVERGLMLASDYALISISCPNDRVTLPKDEFRKDVLFLEFDDLDQPAVILGGLKCKLFSPEDATAIIEFYAKHVIYPEYVIVHCDAGISRSPAVAAALTKMSGHADHDFFKRYLPNRRVYSLLLAEFYKREDTWRKVLA